MVWCELRRYSSVQFDLSSVVSKQYLIIISIVVDNAALSRRHTKFWRSPLIVLLVFQPVPICSRLPIQKKDSAYMARGAPSYCMIFLVLKKHQYHVHESLKVWLTTHSAHSYGNNYFIT